MKPGLFVLCATLPLLAGDAIPAPAAPAPPPRPWTNVATLSSVVSDGNAKGETLGLSEDFSYRWGVSTLVVKAIAIRAASTIVTRTAVGTSLGDYTTTEHETTTTTNENYVLNTRFDHRIRDKDRWYWFSGVGWERNRPAGLDSRYTSSAGFGRIWADSVRTKFRTDLGMGYTSEQAVIQQANSRKRFETGNLTAQVEHKVGASAVYKADLAYTEDLTASNDYRATLRQGVTVPMSKRLALKLGYDIVYRNVPNMVPVEVFTAATPPVDLGQGAVPARRTDTTGTTSLVITF